jgi:nucleotide-binding universal stress UspA family protein
MGTIVCGVTDSDEGRGALELGVELSERLGLRLVLAHVAEGIVPIGGDDSDSVTMKGNRQGAERLLADLAHEYGVADSAQRRVAVGDPAVLVGQIAAEEAADMILVGSRTRGWRRRGLESKLAGELESETPVPVLIAPPSARRRRKPVAAGGAQR